MRESEAGGAKPEGEELHQTPEHQERDEKEAFYQALFIDAHNRNTELELEVWQLKWEIQQLEKRLQRARRLWRQVTKQG